MKKKRASIKIFFSVVYALLMREITTRFGSQKLGYLWAILDTASYIIILGTIKELIHPNAYPGISYPVFLAVSFLGYTMFRNIAIRSMDAFSSNKGLFIYKQVKPFDTIVARFLLEVILSAIVFIILLFIGWYLGLNIECKDMFMVLIGYIWYAIFGLSMGVFFAVFGFFYENFKKIINLIFLPMFFLSALFYTVDSLPPIARKILLLNPIVHFEEFIRGSYFYAFNTQYVNYLYMLMWTVIPLFIGLYLYKKSERKIIMS